MTKSPVAAIGAGVGVAAAAVITLLVVKGEPVHAEERAPAFSPYIPPQMPKRLPDPTPAPTLAAPADRPMATALTEAKVEAEKLKAEQARAQAERLSRAEAIKMARQARALGSTAMPYDGTIFGSMTTIDPGWGPRGRRPAMPTVSLGQFTVAPMVKDASPRGDLDKAIVRRYIKRNLQKIQYCYEKTLLAKPSIKGTATIGFVIEETGSVTNATVAGVDGDVDTCINGVISRIEFPKPKGVGGVKIGTTFTFRPTDR